MKLIWSTLISGAALLAGSLGAGSALAQGTWNLGGGTCNANVGNPTEANCTVGGVTANIEARGNSGAGSSFIQYNLQDNDPSGFGSQTASEGSAGNHHAFDNVSTGCGGAAGTCGGSIELMLLNFGNSKVNLASVAIGFSGGDADLSIYRWDGTSGAVPTTSSLGASWSLVSSMDVDSSGANCINPNGGSFCKQFDAGSANGAIAGATNLYSSWWLVSTYFGSANAAKSLESGNDAYKILNFVANTCLGTIGGGSSGGGSIANNNNGSSCTPNVGVPEPGSLALAGLALVGVFASRRKAAAPV